MRRSLVLALLVVVAATLVPAPPARAAEEPLPAPDLITPIGGVAPSPDLELRWGRVAGAVSYHLQVFHGDPGGYVLVDEFTVNDRWFGRLQQTSGTIWWQVTAVDGLGTAGATAQATFTAAAMAPEPLWPPDGATITHPAETPVLAWRSAYYYETLYGDQDVDAIDPPADLMGPVTPGSWRWQPGPSEGIHPGLPDPAAGEVRTLTYAWPDSAPSLLAPAADAHVPALTSFQLRWGPVDGSGGYDWQLRSADGTVVAGTGAIDATLATWGNVAPYVLPGTYSWRVRARLARTDWPHPVYGDWSEERSITVDPYPVPAVTGPENDALLDTWPMLQWTPVDGAQGYQVQLTTDPAITGDLAATDVAAFAFQPYDGVPYLWNASPARSTRYWRVRAELPGQYSFAGPWSEWRSFTVRQTGGIASVTDAPQVAPAHCPDDSCPDLAGLPVLRWTEVPGAMLYRVFVSWAGDPTGGAWFDTPGTAMPLQHTHAKPGERSTWAVVACPQVADCPTVMPATVRRFRITLPVPAVHGPADGAVVAGPAVQVTWDPQAELPVDVLPPATGYWVRYTTSLNGQETSTQPTYEGARMAKTLEGVADGMTLSWQVRAEAVWAGFQSEWSEPQTFTRAEPPLVITGPDPETEQGPLPLLDWDAPDYTVFAYSAQVTLAADAALYGPAYFRWTFPASGSSVRPSFPLPPGEYRWRVRRGYAMYHLPQEGDGPWTEGAFTVTGDSAIALLSPAPGASVAADAVVLEWSSMPGALEQELLTPGYVVMIGTDPAVPWETSYHWYTDTPRHAVTQRMPEGPLYWRVCSSLACSAVGTLSTGVSEVRAMSVTAAIGESDLTRPTITSRPKPSLSRAGTVKAGSGIPMSISWAGSDTGSGVTSYQVVVVQDGIAGAPVTRLQPSAAVVVRPGHAWKIRVQAVDGAGNRSAWSESRTFTVSARQDGSTAVRKSGTWRKRTDDGWWGRTARSSGVAGATATTTMSGRGVALVSAVGPGRGVAKVYVDGKLVATVPLGAASLAKRRVVWATTWASTATHTVKVKVTGRPAGSARVDLDGFVILR